MNKRIVAYYIFLACVVTVKVGLSIFDNSVVAFYNQEAAEIMSQKQTLSKQYKKAQQQLAENSSLSTLEQVASSQGYQPIKTTITIAQNNAVALSQ